MARRITIHGIKNCDTMKKAFRWLDERGTPYSFHDYKKQGVTEQMLRGWSKLAGWEKLLNKAGTTFRKLPDSDKQGLDETSAIALMVQHPGMIKRPVLDVDGTLLVGFKAEAYEEMLG